VSARGKEFVEMKEKVVVAAVQMDVSLFDRSKNLERMKAATEGAKLEHGAELVVFPELANIGYVKGRDKHFGGRYMIQPSPGLSTTPPS
jgi:predicted amidohydrolase